MVRLLPPLSWVSVNEATVWPSTHRLTEVAEASAAAFAVGSHDIAGRAAAFGMPAVKVDGTDYFAVRAAAKEAIDRARAGGGPSAIEATSVRFYGHFEGDAGREYWLGYGNFFVITRYNRSPMYSLAVHQLAQAIRAGADAR